MAVPTDLVAESVRRRFLVLSLLLAVACGRTAGIAPTDSGLTPCEQLVAWCTASRLPNVTVTEGRTFGALGPVAGLDQSGILTFDDALERAGAYDHLPEATTVRVVLGSADADALRWGHGTNLYYAVIWGGVCLDFSRTGSTGPSGRPTCVSDTWSTVIDARTGAFIVSGN
jgi:hypothetical protein